tara:strand:+ start:183 stop:617 length:435 start_codon:yes stop_codon:yes gene_type:complete
MDLGPSRFVSIILILSILQIEKKKKVEVLLEPGTVCPSEGGQYSYRIIGPCCRLFDREELPWPCSRLAWKSKEPSWRRIGSRFVPDIASRKCPSYSVEILQPGSKPIFTVLTLFSNRFTPLMEEWWYSRHPQSRVASNLKPLLG